MKKFLLFMALFITWAHSQKNPVLAIDSKLKELYQVEIDKVYEEEILPLQESNYPAEFAYAFYDMNQDGFDELIMVENGSVKRIYSYQADRDRLVLHDACQGDFTYRISGFIDQKGHVYMVGSNGALDSVYLGCKFTEDGQNLEEFQEIIFNGRDYPNRPYYFSDQPELKYSWDELNQSLEGEWFEGDQVYPVTLDTQPFHTKGLGDSEPYAGYVDWMPEDWHRKAPRKDASIPDVTWLLMSEQADQGKLLIEPLYSSEKILSGYTNPGDQILISYNINPPFYDGDDPEMLENQVTSDQEGYFEVYLDEASLWSQVRVENLSDGAMIDSVKMYQYVPTALAHPTGNLELERFMLNQGYIEGWTYPDVEITLIELNGYTNVSRTTYSDYTGHFISQVVNQEDQRVTVIVQVQDPETGQVLEVTPYPWTQYELDHVYW